MIISVKWLQDYVDIDVPINELATLIGARLVEIEETIDYGAKYKDVVMAKVISCQPLEGSDHLSVTKLDDGGRVADVERDENGLVQVVCGAGNIRADIFVAWLPPKSIVPETYGTKEPFVLDARKLRGVMSNGMIASSRELAFSDEHEGILEFDLYVEPGMSLVELLHLDDTLLDIENKSLTHRPDVFGAVGFAREVAGIQGRQFETPDWLKATEPAYLEVQTSDIPAPTVTIDNPELSGRYQGVVIAGVDGTAKSPQTLQTYLTRVGVRPISAIVDTTNFLMMESGQPLHAFDYDKLAAVNNGRVDIHVRAGRENETLELLDGRKITLSVEDIVIANGETAVALAGAMGGAATEIGGTTKTIFLESATFNLYNLRATQMRHGIFSEAITRFTKGQPAELTAPVLAQAGRSMSGLMGAYFASEVTEAYPGKKDPITVELTVEKVNKVLGTQFSTEEITRTLRNVEFEVDEKRVLRVTVPYWRNDIHIPEDVIEEIGRLNGFDSIEPILPPRDFTAVRPTEFDQLRARLRNTLVRAGANELLTYSFVHGDLLKNAGQDPQNSYRLTNSLSPSLQYYRQTLTPSLLAHVHGNIKQGYNDIALFELNKVHPKQHGLTDEGVPGELDMLAMVVVSKKPQAGAAYYQAKRFLDFLGAQLGLAFRYEQLKDDPGYPVTAPFQPLRSALVTEATSGVFIGIIGEYKSSVGRAFKLPQYVAGFELGAQDILEAVQKLTPSYTAPSRFPGTERDICFQVATRILYGQIAELVTQELAQQELETAIEPVDIYQAPHSGVKNITVRIKLTSHARTLTSDEATAIVNDVATYVGEKTGATII
jgi:phenylalanyl-tRNA synthetase beta chain